MSRSDSYPQVELNKGGGGGNGEQTPIVQSALDAKQQVRSAKNPTYARNPIEAIVVGALFYNTVG